MNSDVLGVIFKYAMGLLALAAVAYLGNKAFSSNTASTEVSGVQQLISNIHSIYPSRNYDTTAGNILLALDGAADVPSTISSNGQENGTPEVFGSPLTMVGIAGGEFTLTTGIPTDSGSCAAFADAFVPVAVSVKIGSGTALTGATLTQAGIATGCTTPAVIVLTIN